MPTIPLGYSAYSRTAADEPTIRLENRFLETAPANLREKTALLARTGTTELDTFGPGVHRRSYSRAGSFNDALFVFSGDQLWRKDTDGTKTQITGGVVNGSQSPGVCTVKGAGYERLFFTDGLLLQYYDGVTPTMHGVAMPGGVAVQAITELAGFVVVSQAASRRFYWIQPGAIVVDPLDFAEKESGPDDILDMVRVGDQIMILGAASSETWYATGAAPPSPDFAPVQGRAFSRGVVDATACIVKDSLILVGDDGIVYEIGNQPGSTAQNGVNRISQHGVEEAIRKQLRREKGLTP